MPATYEPIATNTLTSGAASVTFSSISGTYTDLVLVIEGYAATADGFGIGYTVNSDTGNNYSHTNVYGNGTTAYSNRTSNSSIAFTSYGVGWSTTSTNRSLVTVHFLNYSNTTTYKTSLARANTTSGSYPGAEASVQLWRSTSAITSITAKPYSTAQFASGTTFTLYGIAAA